MDLMTTNEVGAYLNTPPATLRFWRHEGTGPRSFRMGARRVMYRRQDVDAWIAEQINADQKAGERIA